MLTFKRSAWNSQGALWRQNISGIDKALLDTKCQYGSNMAQKSNTMTSFEQNRYDYVQLLFCINFFQGPPWILDLPHSSQEFADINVDKAYNL